MTKPPKGNYEVGYAKPPRSGQFAKGKSGNALGRPPKSKVQPSLLPELEPTRSLLQKVAHKSLRVREGEKVQEVSMTEAVILGLAKAGAQGGVLAARAYLELQMALDAAEAARRREIFDYWKTYARKARVEIEVARRRGLPLPEPIPHPEDIHFQHTEMTVRFTGPLNEAEFEKCKREAMIAHYLLDILVIRNFCDPEVILNPGPEPDLLVLLYLCYINNVPKRFLVRSPEMLEALSKVLRLPPDRQRRAILERGRLLGLPIDLARTWGRFPLYLYHLRFRDGQLEFYRWPKVERPHEGSKSATPNQLARKASIRSERNSRRL